MDKLVSQVMCTNSTVDTLVHALVTQGILPGFKSSRLPPEEDQHLMQTFDMSQQETPPPNPENSGAVAGNFTTAQTSLSWASRQMEPVNAWHIPKGRKRKGTSPGTLPANVESPLSLSRYSVLDDMEEDEEIYGVPVPESGNMEIEESSSQSVLVATLERSDYSSIQSQVDEIVSMNQSSNIETKQNYQSPNNLSKTDKC